MILIWHLLLSVFAISLPMSVSAQTPYAAFEGEALVAVHDGDMLATAYVDGLLGDQESADVLSVITFSPDLTTVEAATVEVSNSVAGPPTAVAVTPDGRYALVTESFGPRAEGGTQFGDLIRGNRLTLVDIADRSAPRVVASAEIGTRPEGLSISPDGTLAAVALHPSDGRGLALVPIDGGTIGNPSYVTIPGSDSSRISHVEWHPSGDFLALTDVDRATVRFARVDRSGAAPTLEIWGNPVLVSKYPFMGRFTPDGRHFLTGNLYWGADVPGFWTEAPAGDVTSIRFAAEASSEGEPRHFLVGRAETGVSPEGIAISPDGRWVVTTNLERSYVPADDPRHTPFSSLTLIEIDRDGTLRTHGTHAYDGVLPEAAAFDASGRYVAVVTYDQFDSSMPGGSIDFWRLVEEPEPILVKLRRSLSVPHGPHSMVLVD